jgi:dynein intermediate chain
LYNKEIQTSSFVETGPSPDYEAELRQRITREREVEDAERQSQEDALEAESVKLDHEIEREIRGVFCSAAWYPGANVFSLELTEEERASILAAPEFLEFVENSSKILQRALNDGYDYIRDYTINTESGGSVFPFI